MVLYEVNKAECSICSYDTSLSIERKLGMFVDSLEKLEVNHANVGIEGSNQRLVFSRQGESEQIDVRPQAPGVGALGNDRDSELK